MEESVIKKAIGDGYDAGYIKALNDIKKTIEESNCAIDLGAINFFIKITKERLNKTE